MALSTNLLEHNSLLLHVHIVARNIQIYKTKNLFCCSQMDWRWSRPRERDRSLTTHGAQNVT